MDYNELEQAVCAWASTQEDVAAVVVIGSRARESHPADKWSDLDLILFVANPQIYAKDAAWLSRFGEIWLQTTKITGIGDPEWLVLFAGGLKADFLLAPVTGDLSEMLYGQKYFFVTRRGVRILLNKQEDSKLDPIQDLGYEKWRQPDEDAFTAVLNQFWLAAYRAANILQRGELWRARVIIDSELRGLLLCLMEWQAKAVYGSDYEVWHDGRFLPEWADPQILVLLPEIFAPLDKERTGFALLQLLYLGDKLGKETADQWRYHYPAMTVSHIYDWIVTALKN